MQNRLLPYIIYLLINVLFVDKYTMRITEWHYAIDAIYMLGGVVLLYTIGYICKKEYNYKRLLIIGGGLYSIVMICLQYSIDPMTIQVDRWSAIHNFIYNLFHGVFPYSAQTHLGGYGSPFPVWQIIHIPFYFIGNVGLSFFAILALFLYIVSRYESPRAATIALILIALSPAIAYEITVRSDLFSNFLLVCTICVWLQHKHISIEQHTCAIAILCGLSASTRLATVIPLAFLYGFAFLRMDWHKQVVFICTAITTFALTFLPLLLWDSDHLLFFEYNPFVLQTRQGSPYILGTFMIIAIGLVLYKKDHLQHFSLYAGGLLTCLVVITFLCNMLGSGNYQLFSSTYDITYFNMALPFYIYAIATDFPNP